MKDYKKGEPATSAERHINICRSAYFCRPRGSATRKLVERTGRRRSSPASSDGGCEDQVVMSEAPADEPRLHVAPSSTVRRAVAGGIAAARAAATSVTSSEAISTLASKAASCAHGTAKETSVSPKAVELTISW